MKLPITNYDSRFTIWKKSSASAVAVPRAVTAGNRKSAIVNRKSRAGIALVITLILLSVTLVMALAFLAVSRRERSSVTTNTDTTTARLAADSALAQAEVQIISTMLATSNSFNYGLLVSTNYINAAGFISGSSNPTNVNYSYFNGTPLTGNDPLQNLTNLLYGPRPPVYVITNQQTGAREFRYYLDLNRNGRFEETRSDAPNVDNLGNTNGTIPEVGDPQWIGVLERPDTTYGPNNKFLARYAFVAVPAGLDLNYIHNQAKRLAIGSDGFYRNQGVGTWEINLAAFLADLNTNQWDAPTSLNPVSNPYNYIKVASGLPDLNNPSPGAAFNDALSLLLVRYSTNANSSFGSYNNLTNAAALFNGALSFGNDGIDEYANGPLMITPALNGDLNDAGNGFPGADSPSHFFTPSDFFDRAKITAPSKNFIDHLADAGTDTYGGTTVPTYDRYTFYRLLAQLGTDSEPESGKMNLNYDNLDRGLNGVLNINGTASATNFVPWTAITFFTNAADRMLKLYTTEWFKNNPSNYLATYYGITGYNYYHLDANGNTVTNDPTGLGLTNVPYFGITNTIPAFGIANIPVQVNGNFVYRPAVQRVLQLAANIYDASTNNNAVVLGVDYPSVFRPYFSRDVVGNLFVSGYENVATVSGTGDPALSAPFDASAVVQPTGSNVLVNVFGVPWIIGAKKYMPNFNKFYMLNEVQVTRKLQVNRKFVEGYDRTKMGDFSTNQLIFMSITNQIGYSLWNSYPTNYPGGAPTIVVNDTMHMVLTNGSFTYPIPAANGFAFFNFPTNLGSAWPGSAWDVTKDPNARTASENSFIFGSTNFSFLPASTLQFSGVSFSGFGSAIAGFTADTSLPNFPGFGLVTTNWLQAYILDNGHVIDYVQLNGPSGVRNLANEVADPKYTGTFSSLANPTTVSYMWSTNGSGPSGNGPNWGVLNQIYVSQTGPNAAQVNQWKSPPNMPPGLSGIPAAEAAFFNGFFNLSWQYNGTNYSNTNLSQQAPFTPSRTVYQYTLWEANDPLVHYLASDLNDPQGTNGLFHSDDPLTYPLPNPSLNTVGDRYQPWGRNDQMNKSSLVGLDRNPYNLAYRDPLAWGSDNWDFPTNRYPTVGWIGRVHRGTPWQTVYLKATNIWNYTDATLPAYGTNTWVIWTGNANTFDALNSLPVQDHLLFDLFTTALNDNATRGQLSVNVGAPDGPSLSAWSAVFSGVVALTNTDVSPSFNAAPAYTNLVIDPAGANGTNSALWRLANGINQRRATFTNTDGVPHTFEHVGNVLATAQLTEQSPFLNWTSATQQRSGISDEMYEWLPQQTLSLLRASSAPRYVIYCYGQTLTPAPNSILTAGGNFFGMCTNYQVVAETATRAVVRVDGVTEADGRTPLPPSQWHPHIIIESFNILPPD